MLKTARSEALQTILAPARSPQFAKARGLADGGPKGRIGNGKKRGDQVIRVCLLKKAHFSEYKWRIEFWPIGLASPYSNPAGLRLFFLDIDRPTAAAARPRANAHVAQ